MNRWHTVLVSACVLSGILTVEVPATDEQPPAVLKLNRKNYSPNEQILIEFQRPPALRHDGWIGIISRRTMHGDEYQAEKTKMAFAHVRDCGSDFVVLQAPPRGGQFDVRMYANDAGGAELGSVSFSLSSIVPEGETDGVSIPDRVLALANEKVMVPTLGKTTFMQGGKAGIRCGNRPEFTETAWVGLFHSGAAGARPPISRVVLDEDARPRITRIRMPWEIGSYELRFYASESARVAAATMKIEVVKR